MAYDSSPFRRHEADGHQPETTSPIGLGDQPRFRGQPGFRDEPDFRAGDTYRANSHQAGTPYQASGTGYQPAASYPQSQSGTSYQPGSYQSGSYQAGSYQAGGGHQAGGYPEEETRPSVPAAELEEVFDEPDDGSGRDRLAVHWIWEALLLVGVGALAFLLWQGQPSALRGSELSLLLIFATGFGLLGLAAGVTLRAGAPNLAIGPVAVAAGVYFAQRGGDGVATAAGVALVAALVLGAAIALLVTVFHVPGWAASLAGAAAVVVWLQLQPAEIELAGSYDPSGQAAFLFALVAALGILGGLLGTLRGVRRTVGRFRPAGDPAQWRGVLAALVTGGTIMLSMVFAVVAGVLLVAGQGEPIGAGLPVEGRSGVTWLTWTAIGFGVALVGGTSAFGRRGGVFGTTLAVVALVLFHRYQQVQEWEIALLATAAAAVAGGLAVTRLIETLGRARSGEAQDEPATSSGQWETTLPARAADPPTGRHADPPPVAAAGGEGWPASSADSWSSALPARPAPGSADPWDDDRWGRR